MSVRQYGLTLERTAGLDGVGTDVTRTMVSNKINLDVVRYTSGQ